MERKEIIDKFDANMNRNSMEIAQTWEKREKSEFGRKLIKLANSYDEHFRNNGETNVFSLINDAYFFDGEKKECVEKLRKELYKNEKILTDEAVKLFLDLESMADLDIEDTGISEFINESKIEVVSDKSTTLDFEGVDDIEFVLINEKHDYVVKCSKLICTCDNLFNGFYFDCTTQELDDEEIEYLNWKFYKSYYENPSKSSMCADMKIEIHDKIENKDLMIVSLKNAYVHAFSKNGLKLNILIGADWCIVEPDDDDQVANYIRNEISNLFYDKDPRMKKPNITNEI